MLCMFLHLLSWGSFMCEGHEAKWISKKQKDPHLQEQHYGDYLHWSHFTCQRSSASEGDLGSITWNTIFHVFISL